MRQFWVRPTSPRDVVTVLYDWENRRMLEMLAGRGRAHVSKVPSAS
jgi:hypothetical protein